MLTTGTNVTLRNVPGRVVEVNPAMPTPYRVRLADGREALVRADEVEVLPAPIVQVTRIIGTTIAVLTAWVPYAGHSTITHIDGIRYGRVGTEPLPAELNALPAYSDERYERVKAWHAARYEDAYRAILAAHPEAATGLRDMGDITVPANTLTKES